MTCRSLASLRPPGHTTPPEIFLSLYLCKCWLSPVHLYLFSFPWLTLVSLALPTSFNPVTAWELPSLFSSLPLVATALPIQVASWAKSTSLRQKETPPDTLPQQPESWSPGHLLPCSTVSLILFLKDALRVWGDGLVDKALGDPCNAKYNNTPLQSQYPIVIWR